MNIEAMVSAISCSSLLIYQAIQDVVGRGFRDLQAAFSFGLSQIAWRQEQTNC